MDRHQTSRRKFLYNLSSGAAALTIAQQATWPSKARAAETTGVNASVKSIEVTIHSRKPDPVPKRDALQALPGVGSVKVKIVSTDGVVGTSDIGYGRIPGGLKTLQTLIEQELVPVVKDAELSQIRKSYERMVYETDYHGSTGLATLGIAAIDTALWDCLGKTLDVPCWNIWGGCHDKIPAYGMLGWINYDEKQLRERCEHAIQLGYQALKLKIGFPTLKEDVQRVQDAGCTHGEQPAFVQAGGGVRPGAALERPAFRRRFVRVLPDGVPRCFVESDHEFVLAASVLGV